MGTRSITVIENEDGQELCRIYRQFDGYLSVMGEELKDIIMRGPVVSRKNIRDRESYLGMGSLAASAVAQLKTYIRNPMTGDREWKSPAFDDNRIQLIPLGIHDIGEEWIYTISYGGDGEYAQLFAYDSYAKERWEWDAEEQDWVH